MPNLTEEQIKSNLEAFEDAMREKEIQYFCVNGNKWKGVGCPSAISLSTHYRRIPASTLRPWKQKEALIGTQIRSKRTPREIYMIIGTQPEYVTVYSGVLTYLGLLEQWECTTDNGTTWQPCGVTE